jgi:hypothetical protein
MIKLLRSLALGALISALGATSVAASSTSVTGKIVYVAGHVGPSCRQVALKTSGGAVYWFRIADDNNNGGIFATSLTALTTGLTVDLVYDPAITSGCGTEPRIEYMLIHAAGA